MELQKTLSQLRFELYQVDRAILALEELAAARKRGDRPPKGVSEGRVRTVEKNQAESFKTA